MSKEIIIAFFAALLMVITALLFNYVDNQATLIKTSLVIFVTFILFVAMLGTISWFQIRVTSFKDFITKIEHSVDKLLDKQRFIDQEILNIVEGEADYIWVITTKLATELGDLEMQNSVEKNLKDKKEYVYFLPHQNNPNFSTIIERNLSRFKELDLYKKYKSQISFLRLPEDTHFLLEEVVIYNPYEDVDKKSETKGLNGFTYYEDNQEPDEKLLGKSIQTNKYHMRIEGDMLEFLRDGLLVYQKKVGLNNNIQRILSDYSTLLNQNQLSYITGLIKEKIIKNKTDYNNFIDSLKNDEKSKSVAGDINAILFRHVEEAS